MSTALTLHNIDDELYAAVRDYARETKTSLGAAFKQLARRALGLPTAEEKARIDAANALFGCLSEEDVRPIREALKLQSQIEPEMWKCAAGFFLIRTSSSTTSKVANIFPRRF